MSKSECPQVVALGGKLGAGKDAIADYLVAKHGYVKVGMSDPLHAAMMALNPIIHDGNPWTYREAIEAYGYVRTKEDFPEARRLLQVMGTEVGRNILGENVWTDAMVSTVRNLLDAGKRVVVTGVRFENELLAASRFPLSETWYVTRPGRVGGDHASENCLSADDFERVIGNEGTLSDLYAKVERALVHAP